MQPRDVVLRAAVGSFEATFSQYLTVLRLAAPSPKQSITEHERGHA